MRLVFTPHGWEDDTFWLAADRVTLKRIIRLVNDALREPRCGHREARAPSPHARRCLSRRISEEHRLVYLVDGDHLVILQTRFRYT